MTALYEAMEQKLWTKDILKLEIKDKNGTINEKQAWALRNRSQLEGRIGDEMRYLELLGFTGLYSNTIEFDQDYRDTILQRISSSGMIDDLSFIHNVDDYTLDRLSFCALRMPPITRLEPTTSSILLTRSSLLHDILPDTGYLASLSFFSIPNPKREMVQCGSNPKSSSERKSITRATISSGGLSRAFSGVKTMNICPSF